MVFKKYMYIKSPIKIALSWFFLMAKIKMMDTKNLTVVAPRNAWVKKSGLFSFTINNVNKTTKVKNDMNENNTQKSLINKLFTLICWRITGGIAITITNKR